MLQAFRTPAFRILCLVTATDDVVLVVVLGFTPVLLRRGVAALGLTVTAWGPGSPSGSSWSATASRIASGLVQTVAAAIGGLLVTLVLLATSVGTTETIVALVAAGSRWQVRSASASFGREPGRPRRRVRPRSEA